MNPPIYQRVSDLLENAGLTAGYEVQWLIWQDSADKKARFIVVRPNGGSPIDRDMASDYYVMVDVITGTSPGDYSRSENDVQAIIDYVQQNPLNPCIGQITNMGSIPSPVLTTEGRMVWRLQFACLYGG